MHLFNYKIVILCLLLFPLISFSQIDDNIRSAKTGIAQFNQNRNNNSLLNKAYTAIELAGKSSDNIRSREYWKTRAEVLSLIGSQWNTVKLFGNSDEEYLPKIEHPGLESLLCLYQAAEMEGSAASFASICQLMQENMLVLYNEALVQIEYNQTLQARLSLISNAESAEWLISQGQTLVFQNKELHAASYYLASTLIAAEDDPLEKCNLLKKAFNLHHLGATLIEDLLACPELSSDSIAALEVAAMPRYIADEELFLYAKINAGLLEARGDDEFISWLNKALLTNPDGPELLFGASLTHEIRYREEATNGNVQAAQFHFDQAIAFIQKCINTESVPDAFYMAGLIHYNAYAHGLSSYVPKANMDEALAYFILAEIESPNNLPLLSALEFIYHYKNDFEMAEEFRIRMDKIKSGEHLQSYFQR
jgi:hypothetical protein